MYKNDSIALHLLHNSCDSSGCVIIQLSRRTLESARANERRRARVVAVWPGKDRPPRCISFSLMPRAGVNGYTRAREGKRARATTSARRDAFVDARNRRFQGAGQKSAALLKSNLSDWYFGNKSDCFQLHSDFT